MCAITLELTCSYKRHHVYYWRTGISWSI